MVFHGKERKLTRLTESFICWLNSRVCWSADVCSWTLSDWAPSSASDNVSTSPCFSSKICSHLCRFEVSKLICASFSEAAFRKILSKSLKLEIYLYMLNYFSFKLNRPISNGCTVVCYWNSFFIIQIGQLYPLLQLSLILLALFK